MISLEEKKVLSDCVKCVVSNCVYKDDYKRAVKNSSKLELCLNVVAANENKREFAVIERYYDYGGATAFISRYTNGYEKDRISGKYIYNEACYDQYIEYDLTFTEARELVREVRNA